MGGVQDGRRGWPRWEQTVSLSFLFIFLVFTCATLEVFISSSFAMLSFQSHSGQQTIHNNQSSRVESKSSLLYLFVLTYITTTDPAYFILLIFVLFQLVVWARTAAWAASKTYLRRGRSWREQNASLFLFSFFFWIFAYRSLLPYLFQHSSSCSGR